jgi:hypothetical protein
MRCSTGRERGEEEETRKREEQSREREKRRRREGQWAINRCLYRY